MLDSSTLAILSSTALAVVLGVCVVALGLLLAVRSGEARGRSTIIAAAAHPVVTAGLFFTLALHMHRRLDGWPRTIGTAGFPETLVMHAEVAQLVYGALLLGLLFAWPIAVLLCSFVPRLRPGLLYLSVYALSAGVAFGVMQLAPSPFLDWWWD